MKDVEKQGVAPKGVAIDPVDEIIGSRLRLAREGAGLTSEECAAIAGVHKSTYSRYETGTRGILNNVRALNALCKRLNVSADVIIFGRMPRATVPRYVNEILERYPERGLSWPRPMLRQVAAA